MGNNQVRLGGALSVAAGPLGRDAGVGVGVSDNAKAVAVYSYSKAAGLYIGATLDGVVTSSREDENFKFYKNLDATAERVLKGEIQPINGKNLLADELELFINRKGDYEPTESMLIKENQLANPNVNSSNKQSLQDSGRKLLAKALSVDEDLDDGWHEAKTENNEIYYYHDNGQTTWDKPIKPKPKAIAPPPPPPAAPPKKPPLIPKRSYKDLATVLYDYQAQQHDELTISKGQQISIVDKSDPDWFKVSLNGNVGLVPSNYLQLN